MVYRLSKITSELHLLLCTWVFPCFVAIYNSSLYDFNSIFLKIGILGLVLLHLLAKIHRLTVNMIWFINILSVIFSNKPTITIRSLTNDKSILSLNNAFTLFQNVCDTGQFHIIMFYGFIFRTAKSTIWGV